MTIPSNGFNRCCKQKGMIQPIQTWGTRLRSSLIPFHEDDSSPDAPHPWDYCYVHENARQECGDISQESEIELENTLGQLHGKCGRMTRTPCRFSTSNYFNIFYTSAQRKTQKHCLWRWPSIEHLRKVWDAGTARRQVQAQYMFVLVLCHLGHVSASSRAGRLHRKGFSG